jgi:arginyl-tRNA synthetase
MLTRKNDAPLDFDFDKALEQSKENPVFYVQYAHARANSVLGRAAQAGFAVDDGTLAAADLGALGTAGELALVRKLAEWPRQVEIAAQSHEPHRIAFYLYDLASEFHALQHQGKLEPELRFVREDEPGLSRARLALVRATQVVVATGLGILGVTPMDEMR